MNIEIKRLGGDDPTTFEDFAAKHNLKLIVSERPLHYGLPQYHCSFYCSEVAEGAVLRGVYGDGATHHEAMRDYMRRIAGRLLVIGAYTSGRREIQCPNGWLESSTTTHNGVQNSETRTK